MFSGCSRSSQRWRCNGRKTPLRVFAPAPFGEILACHLRYFDTELPYTVAWTEVDTTKHALLLENRTLEVWSVRCATACRAPGSCSARREPPLNVEKFKIEKYGLSIAQITAAKRGEEIRLATGEVIPNAELTYRPYAPRSYAYLSDTNYAAKAAGLCRGVDLMYHEATYAAAEQRSARDRGHSTATTDAARAALKAGARRLVIGHYSSRYKDETPLVEEARTALCRELPGDRRNHLHHRKTTMTRSTPHTTRPRAGRQTRPHGAPDFSSPRRNSSANCAQGIAPLRTQDILAGRGFQRARGRDRRPARHGAALAARNPEQLAGAGRNPPLRPEAGAAAGTADAGARRRAEPREPGHNHPAGRLVRHHGHRLLRSLGRLFQPQGRTSHDGGDPPRKGPLHRPRGAAFEGRRAGTSGAAEPFWKERTSTKPN